MVEGGGKFCRLLIVGFQVDLLIYREDGCNTYLRNIRGPLHGATTQNYKDLKNAEDHKLHSR
jgi:hypothetical protein